MSDSYLSVSLSPLNKSRSKQLYSFAKSIRFTPTPEPPCRQSSYDTKRGAFGQRATTFGYGNKISLASKQRVPPVGNYQLKSEFIHNCEKRRGYAFSRRSRADTLVNPEKASKLPGPGAYDERKSLRAEKFKSISFSMGQKLIDPMSRHQNETAPGQYETIGGTSPDGKYIISRWSASGCRKIGKAQRLGIVRKSETPGPGKYRGQNTMDLNKTGVYLNSRMRNMEASRFSKSNRPPLGADNRVPGPGSYTAFTQFAPINKSWRKN